MSKNIRKLLSLLMTVMMIVNVVVVFETMGSTAVYGADTNLALNKPVTSSGEQVGNEASHAVDGDTTNRWSSQVFPQWISVDLGSTYSITKTEIVPHLERAYQFKVEVSTDGTNYTQVVNRTGNTTGGALIADTFAAVDARYVRLTVTGCYNDTTTWASISEFRVIGDVTAPTPTPTPTPPSDSNLALNKAVTCSSEQAGNEATHAVDGDAAVTRWSAQTFPQWMTVDLGAAYDVNKTEVVPYTDRAYQFKVEVSTDGTNYTQVVNRTGNTTGGALIADVFTPVNARYVRLTVTGCYNDTTTWASINEFRVFSGASSSTPTPTPTPVITPTPTPTPTPSGNVRPVSSISQLNSALANAQPGDIIELADGTYNGTINALSGLNGTAAKNIIIRAKNVDKAVLAGPAKFDLSDCSYITIEGMKITSSVTVGIKLNSCNNIRVTRCRLRTTETAGADNKYILIQGANSHHNRIDRNIFEEKHEMGQMLAIHGSSTQVSQYDVVELNYFKNFYTGPANGYETIRVGLSGISMSSGYTIIQNNLFENTDGENECVSLKASDLTVRYNTFRNVKGECTSRHGNRHSVYGNFFLADGIKASTAGVRVFGQDHKYYNNVFKGLTGTAIVINGGDVDTSGPLNEHWRQYRTEVAFNTIINCADGIVLGGKPYPPIDSKIANNIFKGTAGTLISDISSTNTLWQGNIAHATGSASVGVSKGSGEVRVVDPQLVAAGELFRLSGTSPAIDAALGTYSYVTTDMDGQTRSTKDIGADEYSTEAVTRAPLTSANVGIFAP